MRKKNAALKILEISDVKNLKNPSINISIDGSYNILAKNKLTKRNYDKIPDTLAEKNKNLMTYRSIQRNILLERKNLSHISN